KQHQTQIKEIRVRPKTGDHDIEVKVKRAREFLEHKDKVLVNVLFRGRELAHIEEGRKVMDEVLQSLEEVAKVEKNPSMEGKRMTPTQPPAAAPPPPPRGRPPARHSPRRATPRAGPIVGPAPAFYNGKLGLGPPVRPAFADRAGDSAPRLRNDRGPLTWPP